MFDINNITSEYSHQNSIAGNHFSIDCSGFVAHYLGKLGYLHALAELRSYSRGMGFLKINRFYCNDFDDFFESCPRYWTIVQPIKQNDIIIVIFPDNNGHCMIVDKVIENSGDVTKIRVLDSTRFPHKNDTRKPGNTGIGFGEIEISGNLYNANNPNLPVRGQKYILRARSKFVTQQNRPLYRLADICAEIAR
jgi:hypothetical protein